MEEDSKPFHCAVPSHRRLACLLDSQGLQGKKKHVKD